MGARSGHERGQSRHPVFWPVGVAEQHVRGAITEGMGEFQHVPSGGIDREALEGNGRASG